MEAMDCVRIISLLLFGEYACGQETPLLAYNVTNNCYVSIAPQPIKQEDVGHVVDQVKLFVHVEMHLQIMIVSL